MSADTLVMWSVWFDDPQGGGRLFLDFSELDDASALGIRLKRAGVENVVITRDTAEFDPEEVLMRYQRLQSRLKGLPAEMAANAMERGEQ